MVCGGILNTSVFSFSFHTWFCRVSMSADNSHHSHSHGKPHTAVHTHLSKTNHYSSVKVRLISCETQVLKCSQTQGTKEGSKHFITQ